MSLLYRPIVSRRVSTPADKIRKPYQTRKVVKEPYDQNKLNNGPATASLMEASGQSRMEEIGGTYTSSPIAHTMQVH